MAWSTTPAFDGRTRKRRPSQLEPPRSATPDPEVNRRANALTKIAADMQTQFRIAEAAHEEAVLTPIRSINVRKMREQRLGVSSPSLGTLAILLSPLALAGALVWWRSR